MPRDYKNRSQATPEPETDRFTTGSGYGWLCCGTRGRDGRLRRGRYPGTIVAFNAPEFPVPDAVAMADVRPKKQSGVRV